MLAVLVPAAGASSRMGARDKLLEPVAGQPLLRLMVARALSVTPHVAVTLRAPDPERRAVLAGLDVVVIPVPDAATGMAASLRVGADWALSGRCSALMVVLPDMPDITTEDLHTLVADYAHHPDTPLRAASHDGQPGNPVILPRALWPLLSGLSGDQGARAIFATHPPRLCALQGDRALTDLDTPEAWARWRK
ncbi:MAG: NTP transferase domain-containing protein [Roseinatronobacter sp.]